MLYQQTQVIIGYNFHGVQPGQWISLDDQRTRGQYLGTTKRGTDIIRWQNDKFTKTDALANKPLRDFAKLYGSH